MNAQRPIAERIAPLVPRLAPLIGKLGSVHDGEIVAAARAIGRQLERSGLAWTDLGRALEGGPPQRVEFAREPDILLRGWRCAVQWIRSHPLWEPSEREQIFVLSMDRLLKRHQPTAKQQKWLRDIIADLGGRMDA